MARPRKSVAELKLTGTLQKHKDRYDKQVATDEIMSKVEFFPPDTTIKCPATIKDKVVQEFWNSYTRFSIGIHILKPQDLPLLESMCIDLQRLRDITAKIQKLDVTDATDDEVDVLLKRKTRIENSYNVKAQKFYVSPQDRSKLVLDSLDIQSKQTANQSAITRAMNGNNT